MSDPAPDSPAAWLARARSDLALARVALQTPDVLAADACFHAQQCAEKALKALLVHLGTPFPRTHVLELLLDLAHADDIDLPIAADDVVALTQYAVETRYPGAWEPVDHVEAERAVEHAALLFQWVADDIDAAGEVAGPTEPSA